jgi:DNA invertase Pin-like site-specific DNA recombinase
METRKFVSYFRVSTARQGASGLGLEAQQAAVTEHLRSRPHKLVGTFTEVESGKRSDRPQLDLALAACRTKNAVLIVGKLDRLARDVQFLLKVVAESGEAGVVFCDLPSIPDGPVGKFILTTMASVSELEAGLISKRTKEALAAAKRRGVKLGGDRGNLPSVCHIGAKAAAKVHRKKAKAFRADVGPRISALRESGLTWQAIVDTLNDEGVLSARGGLWSVKTVRRILGAK